ncbi:MAG: class I SAM-dependent methyltransferase [Thermoanaerobaculia bacterium]|nr:class I SAM-dependent methyltransferase [Thermoanaerobaculia bacterium]
MSGAPQPGCVVCGSARSRVVFREHDVDVVRCRGCGHVYSTYTQPQEYDGYFGDAVAADEQFWWDAAHGAMYRDFGRRFLTGRRGRLLDAGCGLGFFVRFVGRQEGWAAHGWEISPAAAAYARRELGLGTVVGGPLEQAGLEPGSFDLVTLWDVLEHVPAPDPLLGRLHGLLAVGGRLFLHTPNARFQLPKARLKRVLLGMRPGVHYLEARDHVNLYTPASLRRVLERNGFADVRYLHLPPIQSVSGSRSPVLTGLKNLWAAAAAGLDRLTLGRVNLDNLFAVATRRE